MATSKKKKKKDKNPNHKLFWARSLAEIEW